MNKKLAFCVFETRRDCEVGVRLAVASLRRHYPQHSVVLFWTEPSEDLRNWLDALGQVTLISEMPFPAKSWNVKAQALLHVMFECGFEQAMWIDSDMIITRPVLEQLEAAGDLDVLIAQEPESQPHQGSASRVEGWGLKPGNAFSYSINTSLVRVTRQHAPLLERWKQMQEDPIYSQWQVKDVSERPLHYMGDQDIFQALLGSAEFAHLPVKLFRSGREVIHCGGALGYAFGDRVWGLAHRVAPFVHAIGTKPWRALRKEWGNREPRRHFRYRQLLQETSPYVLEARNYRDEIGMPMPWLDYQTTPGRLMRLISLNRHCLQGWPLSAAAAVAARLGKTSL